MIKTFQKKYEKLRSHLLKIKELNEVVLEKWLFASIKGKVCLTIGHLGNRVGHLEVEYPLHRELFLTLLIQIKIEIFFKKDTF